MLVLGIDPGTASTGYGLVGAHLVGDGARALGGHAQSISIDDRAHGIGVLIC